MINKEKLTKLLETYSSLKQLLKTQPSINPDSTEYKKAKEILEALKAGLNRIPRDYQEKIERFIESEEQFIFQFKNEGAQKSSNNQNNDKKRKNKINDALEGAIIAEKPNITWDNIAGLENAKSALKQAVIFPARFPSVFVGLRKPWKGILLYGVVLLATRNREDSTSKSMCLSV